MTDDCPVKLRQKVDRPSQGKVIGDSFPTDWNSKMRVAGQLRKEAGPCPDHIFLILEVRRSPQPHICRKTPWKPKKSYVKRCSLPIRLSSKSLSAKRSVHTNGRILRYTKYGLQTRQVKMIGQRKPGKKYSIKVIQTAQLHNSTTQGLSASAHVSIYTYYTFFPPNRYFTCFPTFQFVEILFCKTKGPKAFVTDHWSSG